VKDNVVPGPLTWQIINTFFEWLVFRIVAGASSPLGSQDIKQRWMLKGKGCKAPLIR